VRNGEQSASSPALWSDTTSHASGSVDVVVRFAPSPALSQGARVGQPTLGVAEDLCWQVAHCGRFAMATLPGHLVAPGARDTVLVAGRETG